MKRPWIKDKKDAMSTATTIMFLLAIFVFIYSTIIGIYLPEWAKAEEKSSMEDVKTRFVEMQQGIAAMYNYGSGATITYPVKLGSKVRVKAIEILEAVSAGGTLRFDKSNETFSMSINDTTGGGKVRMYSCNGTLEYEAHNTYYPSQTFAYVNGAMMRRQGDKSFLVSPPSSLDLYVSRGTLNSNSNATFQYDTFTGLEYAESVSFLVPGRPGDYNISYSCWMVSTGEVGVWVNGVDTGIRLEADTSGGWSTIRYITLSDASLYDGGVNNITFLNIPNHNTGLPYIATWGIRNVSIVSDFVRLTLPGITLDGTPGGVGGYGLTTVNFNLLSTSQVDYRAGGEGGNYTITIHSSVYLNAWKDLLTTLLKSSDLQPTEYTISSIGDTLIVSVYGVDELIVDKSLVGVSIG